MSWLDRIEQEDVVDVKSFYDYAQQEVGIPKPYAKEIAILRKTINQFFEDNPNTDWNSLAKIVVWAKRNKARFQSPTTLVMYGHRKAFVAGYLPELDPNYIDTDRLMEARDAAIRVETDEKWTEDLYYTTDNYLVEKLYEWLTYRNNNDMIVPEEVKGYFL